MASHNTFYDSANTATRAFLTKVGAFYNDEKSFNTSSGKSKGIWKIIKKEFDDSCAYCGDSKSDVTMEHLVMINREEYGLHHPGNVVPCCKSCNKRIKKNKKYLSWTKHLKIKAKKDYKKRLNKIRKHIKKYRYPIFTEEEKKSIKVIANSLYNNIVLEGEKSSKLYWSLRKEFIKSKTI